MKTLCALSVAALLVTLPVALRAEVDREDLILLSLIFRNRVVPYLEREDALPEVREIAEASAGFRRAEGDDAERFKMLAKGVGLLTWGEWNERREVATVLDMRLGAKLFEPGDTIAVHIAPVWERPGRFSEHFMIHVTLLDGAGEAVGKPERAHLHQMAAKEMELAIPRNATDGRYSVHYTIEPHHRDHGAEDEGPLLEGERTLFVLSSLRSRLEALRAERQGLQSRSVGAESRRHALALSSIDWLLALYTQGLEGDVPGAYGGHPLFMTSMLRAANYHLERIDFVEELGLAESLAAGLAAGDDPLATRTGDMRLAYVSPRDGELVPFRLFVPDGYDRGQSYPLVMGLHGAGGDENAFMDRYSGLFKKNAAKRGYLAVSANGRGPYGGYRGKSGEDVLDVIDLVAETHSVDEERIFLTGHSMGGAGTVQLGFDHGERFAALAPIAGFGSRQQLAKAQLPILVAQGEKDALVPVDSAREFAHAALDAGLEVRYIEKRGIDHIAIVELVMEDVFDWFDRHAPKR